MSAHLSRRRHRARTAAISLTLAGVLAGCSSPAAGPPGAPAPQSRASGASGQAAARVFTSRLYGYTVALPAGWSADPGERWGGTGESGPVDVFRGQPYVVAWAFAAPRPPSLAGYASAAARAAAQLPCPAVPRIDQQLTIGGAAASLIGMSCPSQGGVFMLTAAATHKQTALVFVFEDSSGVKAAEHADRAVFGALLASIRFRR